MLTINHHYQLAVHGFQKNPAKHIFGVQFHFDIIDEKVWIQCNRTDWDFGDDLIERGISKEDIVPSFLPEYARLHSGFLRRKVVAIISTESCSNYIKTSKEWRMIT